MKRPFYTIINVIYQLIICWLLVILNAFYNDLLIPESLAHSSARLGLKMLIAFTEGIVLIAAAYAGNRVSLSDKDDKVTQKKIANRTGIVQLIITVCFMIVVILS
jgi:amino acid transporter